MLTQGGATAPRIHQEKEKYLHGSELKTIRKKKKMLKLHKIEREGVGGGEEGERELEKDTE